LPGKIVIGESGIGWIPYVLERMDAEWEDQFKDLSLTMRPSEFWRCQCRATYQSDRIGIKLVDDLGHDTIMWGSDFPDPDGVWPDSSEFIERELGHLLQRYTTRSSARTPASFTASSNNAASRQADPALLIPKPKSTVLAR
jgi:hypothetical protein